MDGQTGVTEMDRGGVYKMDRHTKCQKKRMPLKWTTFYRIFLQVLECVITFGLFQWHFHVYFALFRLFIS